jgi:hypothetical protein
MKNMFSSLALALSLFFSFHVPAFAIHANDNFPIAPNEELTPGSLCQRASERRYPERIVYCERNVDSSLKREVMRTYDRELGFSTTRMNRGDFKIDHYIPLCAGGANDASNLWPQHRSVYEITDPMEQAVCEAMARGGLLQKDAVELIRKGKNNLDQVEEIVRYVHTL